MTTRARVRNQQQLENESISERLDSAILWIALGTLFIVPLVFSFKGFVAVFSELKLVTLHLGAGLIAILWLWKIAIDRMNASGGRGEDSVFDIPKWVSRNPAKWLILLATTWIVAQAVSTLLSPLPIVSLLGADDLRSGYNFYDNISLFVLFVVVATQFRTERRLKLLVYTLVSSGTVAAAYGIAQHFGWDPLGDSEGRVRVWSSFGNPLNFGAYMVMTIPATLALAIPNRERRNMWLGVLAVAVGLQIAGLWFTGGRGPYIAFVVSMLSFGAIGLGMGQLRSLAHSAIGAIAGLVIAIVIVVVPSPKDDIGVSRVLSIGDQIVGQNEAELDEKSGLDARFDIWGTTLQTASSWDSPRDESAVSSALRPVFGLGPDMFVYSYPLVADPGLSTNLVDHPHNYELQILMEQGVVGLLLILAVMSIILLAIYRASTTLKSLSVELGGAGILLLAIGPAVIGKLVEMQSGVSRVSDLAMTFALFGAVASISVLVSKSVAQAQAVPGESPSSRFALSMKPGAVSSMSILVALAVTAIVLTTLVGWDLRRTTASRSWSAATSAPTDVERATGWFESQADAPERPLLTNSLFIELFNAAIDQHGLGEEGGALQLMHTARQLLLDFEDRDPYKRDVQLNLFKTEVFLTNWGQSEFADEAVTRAERIFDLYPAYLSMLQIVAYDMPFIGRDDLEIEYNARIQDAT